ncbi:MAG: MarR family transcriptional regulator [Rhodospirillales bacterium]|nr:MarR family transcriptional regulator [Rhodospirillales bacterium]
MQPADTQKTSRTAEPEEDSIDYDVLPDLVGYHLRRAQIAVFSNFSRTIADHQITPGQFGVLTLIAANPGLTQSALAKAVGIERSTMVATIDALEGRKLVERRPSPVDRRSYALMLSNEGRGLVAKLKEKVVNHENDMMAAVSDEDRATLIRLLGIISNSR